MKLIREATKELLTTALSLPVFDTRLTPSQLNALPCAVVYNKRQSIANELPNGLGISGACDVQLNIDVVVSYKEGFAPILDTLVDNVIEALKDSEYQKLYNNIDQVTVDYQYISELEKPIAVAAITVMGRQIK